jgi:uncharacterized protein (TIGR01777 family)
MINLNKKNQKFLITGGTGFIGSKLVKEILKDGHEVTVLTRNKKLLKEKNQIKYINNLEEEFNYDVVINLGGEPISQRWTKNKKTKIYNSRITLTKKLVEIIKNSKMPPKLVISGSAIGYYGTSQNQIFDEEVAPTNQNLFSQNLCQNWEKAAIPIKEKSRLVIIRTGVVIGKNGGIIKKIFLPFKFGFGGKIGDGKQNLSWIYIDDVIGIINLIINNQNIVGAINISSSSVTTNEIFSKTLAKILNRPCIFNMPSFIAKIIFGQMADELLLGGQNVIPKKLLQSGYNFEVKNIEEALKRSI